MTRRSLPALLLFLFVAVPADAERLALEASTIPIGDHGQTPRVEAAVLWGSITVRSGPPGEVSVSAVVEGLSDPEAAAAQGSLQGRARIELHGDGRDLSVRVPVAVDGFYGVHLELRVPPRSDLSLLMERGGEIEIRGVQGLLEIENRNGSVQLLGVGGAAAVDCRNGSIGGSFLQVDAGAPMSFTSLNGSVDLQFPPDLAASLSATAHRGEVRFEHAPPEAPGQQAPLLDRSVRSAAVGGGGPAYFFYTANGSVVVSPTGS